MIGVNAKKNDFVLSCTCDQIKPIIVCLSVSCKKDNLLDSCLSHLSRMRICSKYLKNINISSYK